MGTDYEPPEEKSYFDSDTANKLILRMEQEMTKARQGNIPNSEIDSMLSSISKTSTDILIQRREMVKQAEEIKSESVKQVKETNKQKKLRLHD